MFPGEPFRSGEETSEALARASVSFRSVPWLRRAVVAALAALTHEGRWRLHDAAAAATVYDYAHEVLESLTIEEYQYPAPQSFDLYAITTSANQTVTITGLRSSAGAFEVNFGDLYAQTYPAGYTGTISRTYAAPGVYRVRVTAPLTSIYYFVAGEEALVIPPGTIGAFTGLTVLQLDNMSNAFVGSGEIAGKTDLSFLWLRNVPGVAFVTGFQQMTALSYLRYTNALTSAQVSATLAAVYGAFPRRTVTGGDILLAGTNAAPGGVYANVCPPTTGQQYRYQLLNDGCAVAPSAAHRWTSVAVT